MPKECAEDQRNAKQKLVLQKFLLMSFKDNYLEQNISYSSQLLENEKSMTALSWLGRKANCSDFKELAQVPKNPVCVLS